MENRALEDILFRKSTHSMTGECVEVGCQSRRRVAVRDSKDADGSWIWVSSADWLRFADQVKADGIPRS